MVNKFQESINQLGGFLTEASKPSDLQPVLDSLFKAYVTMQHHHWNVEGPNFGEYHAFIGELYELVYGHMDMTAEQMRTLGQRVKLSKLNSSINENMSDREMLQDCITLMNEVRMKATKANNNADAGISNYLEGLIDEISKKIWMAESYLK